MIKNDNTVIQMGDILEATVAQLATLFPGVPAPAWLDAIHVAKRRPTQYEADAALALHWLELAKEGRLRAIMDPAKGPVVMEVPE